MSGPSRDALVAEVAALIDRLASPVAARAGHTTDTALGLDAAPVSLDEARDALLAALAAFQAAHVPAYARLCAARGLGAALPTDVFRLTRVASHPPSDDLRVFQTSGTTSGARGAHPFRDLALYARAARAWARAMLFPDVARLRLVVLAPSEQDAPDSSLSYMLARFGEWFGSESTSCWRQGALDLEALERALERARRDDAPVALLGTSFAFVYAEDELGARRFALPRGSRVMQTGGFKGRTREVAPEEMRAALSARYAVPVTHVVAEYGMTELSSQAYETTIAEPGAPRRYRFGGWVRVRAVDPQTLAPTTGRGLLRIDDPANVDSVSAILTSDLATVAADGGFELHGRAPGATPRGCSLAIEEAMG